MKKLQRALAFLLAACLLLGALTACGSAAQPDTGIPEGLQNDADRIFADQAEEAEPEEAVSAAAAAEEGTAWPENPLGSVELPLTTEEKTITVWSGVNPNVLAITEDITGDCIIWQELEKRTGVQVEFTAVNPEVQEEKFQLMVAGGDLTDVVANLTGIYPGGGEAAIADGVSIDHLPYLTEELTPQICSLMELEPEAVPNALTESGCLAGIPQISMQTEENVLFGPMIREDWLDAVGMEVPETYDELYEVLSAFRNTLGAEAPLVLSYAGTGINNGMVHGFGINAMVAEAAESDTPFYQVDGEVRFGCVQPEFRTYLTMLHQWYEEGLLWSDFMTAQDIQNPPEDLILSDETGVFYSEVSYMAALENASDDPEFSLEAAADFVLNTGDTIPFGSDAAYAAETPWSITTACSDPELVMQWCNYLYTDDGALLCNYGIEGESFEYDADGTPVFTDTVLNNPKMSTTVALFLYCMDRGPFYRDEEREESGYTENQKQAEDIWKSNLVPGRGLGSTTLSAAEADTISVSYSDICTYAEEEIPKFITGERSLDTFDAFCNILNAMGLKKVTAAWQEAYDRDLSGEVTGEETQASEDSALPEGQESQESQESPETPETPETPEKASAAE